MSRYLRWISNVRVWVGRGGRGREEGKEKGGEKGGDATMGGRWEGGCGCHIATLPSCHSTCLPTRCRAEGVTMMPLCG